MPTHHSEDLSQALLNGELWCEPKMSDSLNQAADMPLSSLGVLAT